jgi:hypothetical protein
MNNSDQPFSPEEKWAAYVDGHLGNGEAATFEREHPDAAYEKAVTLKMREFLRGSSPAPVLRNPDFFNRQILREIAPEAQPADRPITRDPLMSLWRFALAGACCLVGAAAIYTTVIKGNDSRREPYTARVLSVKAGDDALDATVLDADGLAVVWIDGLDPLPNDYVLQ